MGIIKLGDIFDKEQKGHEYSGILLKNLLRRWIMMRF